MPLPNLIVIGAQKCGTTSVHHYLDLHPEIGMARSTNTNEVHFFSSEAKWGQGIDWYARQFPETPVRGDVSPSYSQFPFRPHVPERIRELVPDVRLIYLVRDPIERIASDWYQARAARSVTTSFAEALSPLEDNIYVARSSYATQLARYLALFPQERILVVDQNDLRHDRAATLRTIFEFAGADPSFTTPAFADELNVTTDARPLTSAGRRVMLAMHGTLGHRLTHALSGRVPVRLPVLERARPEGRPLIDSELRERLTEVLAPEVERLRSLTGQRFASWSL